MLGDGSSLLFTGPPFCGKIARKTSLVGIAQELKIPLKQYNRPSEKLIRHEGVKSITTLFVVGLPISEWLNAVDQEACQTITIADFPPEKLADYKEEISKRKIEVFLMPPQRFNYPNEKHRRWARSWVLYKNPNSSVQQIGKRLDAGNKDLFDFLSFDQPADLEKIISLYLLKIDLSGQEGYRDGHGEWLRKYAEEITLAVDAVLQIATLVELVLSYL